MLSFLLGFCRRVARGVGRARFALCPHNCGASRANAALWRETHSRHSKPAASPRRRRVARPRRPIIPLSLETGSPTTTSRIAARDCERCNAIAAGPRPRFEGVLCLLATFTD